jgi:hypothetical protein
MTDKLKCFAGFDPGKSGAFSFYFRAAPEMIAAEDFTLVNGEIDAATLADRLRQMRPDFAIIERVGAMPKQGVSSTFKGVKVSDAEMAPLNISGDAFHPEWNYTITPRSMSAST